MKISSDKLLISKLRDKIHKERGSGIGFLKENEIATAINFLKSEHLFDYRLDGGYPEAERKFIIFGDEEGSCFFKAIKISHNGGGKLTHRDYLGSLMSLLIKRESIGDILIYEGYAIAFLAVSVAQSVLNELIKVANKNVSVEYFDGQINDDESSKLLKNGTVAALRLDAVVAEFINSGRSSAVTLIEKGLCAINGVTETKKTKMVNDGDSISVRGYGKFKFIEVVGQTKKGNLKISFIKYI